jgi:hypothetical protein
MVSSGLLRRENLKSYNGILTFRPSSSLQHLIHNGFNKIWIRMFVGAQI